MSNPNPNQENLRKFTDMTPEEHRELSKKGAIASAESKRTRKTMKEMLDILLSKNIKTAGGENTNALEVMMTKLVQEAMNGSIKAITIIRDTIGEKPVDVVQFSPTEDNIKDIQSMIDDGK